MTEHEAFLQAITESSDDNTPRLVYADWLEENGQGSRAEFIRVQIELAREDLPEGQRFHLNCRETELLQTHREQWLAELPKLDGVTWETFRRGFLDAIHVITAEAFCTHAEAIFSAAPIQEVNFRSVLPDAFRDLAELPAMSRLRAFMLQHQQLLNVSVLALAGSKFLSDLVEMWLPGNHIGDAGAEALAESQFLTRLKKLDLRDNQLTDAGVQALARSQNLARLQTLYLVNNQLGDNGLTALAESVHLSQLKHLYLNHNQIGDGGVRELAFSSYLSELEELDLRNNQITWIGAEALATSPYLQKIKELLLTGNNLDNGAVEQLKKRFGRVVRA